jgi:regulator of sirC expression with transglutaminase-like and TPR domain
MNVSFALPSPLDYFSSLVSSESDFALFEAAVSLAQDEHPSMDVQGVLHEVDQLLAQIRRRLPDDAPAMQKLIVLNHFFYYELGFGAPLNIHYEADHNFVSMVLRRNRGMAVTLGVLWLELAQGLGMTAEAVTIPGFFMVTVHLPLGQAVLDPLTGKSLSKSQLLEMQNTYLDRSGLLSEAENRMGLCMATLTNRDIIERMLRNLKMVYTRSGDLKRQLAVHERLVVLLPEDWAEYRDRGLLHAQMGHSAEALSDLECYMVCSDAPSDADAIAGRIDLLRSISG